MLNQVAKWLQMKESASSMLVQMVYGNLVFNLVID